MRRLEPLDFRLQQVVVTDAVRRQVLSRKATLLILPFRPQPSLSPTVMADLVDQGAKPVCNDTMLQAARIALASGILRPPLVPIGIGCAFALHCDLPPKTPNFGTGIVLAVAIGRYFDLSDEQKARAGYGDTQEFRRYWDQATADLAPGNHWCWLIEFDYRG